MTKYGATGGMVSTEIKGLDDINKLFMSLAPRAADNVMRNAVVDVAREARDVARDLAPRDTGQLRKSIKAKRNRSTRRGQPRASVYIELRAGKKNRGPHWHFFEYGTVKMGARPFLVPAIVNVRGRMPKLIRKYFGLRFEKQMAKQAKTNRAAGK